MKEVIKKGSFYIFRIGENREFNRISLCILSIIGVSYLSMSFNPLYFSEDAAQYFSVAENILNGRGIKTSIIYYEAQQNFSKIPAPQTIFPPGFPTIIAVISLAGVDYQKAAFSISVVSWALSGIILYLLFEGARLIILKPFIFTITWYCIVINWFNVLGCLSDMCYVFCTLLSLLFVQISEKKGLKLFLFIAGCLAAVAFTMRYVGLFFITSVLMSLLMSFSRIKSNNLIKEIFSFGVSPVICIFIIFWRNYSLSETLSGGRVYPIDNTIVGVVTRYYYSISKIFGLSWTGFKEICFAEIFFIFFIIGCFLLAFRVCKNERTYRKFFKILNFRNNTESTATIYIFLYLFALGFLELKTMDAIEARYIIPVIPFMLFVLGREDVDDNSKYAYKIVRILTCVSGVIVFTAGQVNVFYEYSSAFGKYNRVKEVELALLERFESKTVKGFLENELKFESPLLGHPPQLIAGYTKWPVVGLPSSYYSAERWTTKNVKNLVERFNIKYLLILPKLIVKEEIEEQCFLRCIFEDRIPNWLKVRMREDRVWILEVLYTD
jgi:hypothetical protein